MRGCVLSHLDRFWSKVHRGAPDQCWPWKGATSSAAGYGQIASGAVDRKGNRIKIPATHVALASIGQSRPSPLHVAMHSCDNPRCVNPAHLSWGTSEENANDRIWKHRAAIAAGQLGDARRRAGGRKLSENDVQIIRASGASELALAEVFGIGEATIQRIRRGDCWNGVPIGTVSAGMKLK